MNREMKRTCKAVAGVMGILLALAGSAGAGQKGDHHPQVGHLLGKTIDEVTGARATTRGSDASARTFKPTHVGSLARVREGDRIQVYVHLLPTGGAVKTSLREMGAEIEIADYERGVVQAWLPVDQVEAAAELPFVEQVTLPDYGRPRIGSVTTEGDAILRADELRERDIDGTGVRVGVISDGANAIGDAHASGDLPSPESITTFGMCDPDATGTTCNEGTAMLEIVYDLAPGASLGFCAVSTSLDFIECVGDLQDEFGADVIVDDIGFPTEPYFEDGPVAERAADAVADGVVFVSAAGNDASATGSQHYEADFRGVERPDFSGRVHDFGTSAGRGRDTEQSIRVEPGDEIAAVLQWSDPFGGSSNDYDLWLINSTGQPIASSRDIQDGAPEHIPLERLVAEYRGEAPTTVHLLVERFDGNNRRIEMLTFTRRTQYHTPEGSVYGHPAVPGVLAVGAIGADDPGHDDIEPFSSRGPSEVFFPVHEVRPKPDITGIDGVSVSGAGGFPETFFGTSAAAPHIAGIAALLESGFDGDVAQAIQDGAVDLGSPGDDNVFGAGRADAVSAAQAIQTQQEDPDDDGGGGSVGPLALLGLLAAAHAMRRRASAM